jgi:thiazole synthase
MVSSSNGSDPLTIGGRLFSCRLLTGTGKYPSIDSMQSSIERSACEMVTVAVRRVQTGAAGHAGLMEAIDWSRIWMLPNTAGCTNAEEAIRVARLGRELAKLAGQEDNNFIKLEVIPDSRHLLPDPIGTLHAAEALVKEGIHSAALHQCRPSARQTLRRRGLRHSDASRIARSGQDKGSTTPRTSP